VTQYVMPPESSESQDEAVVLPFPLEELPVNSGRIFRFGADPGIVIRTPSGEVRAFSARCTHLSCIVQYAPEQSRVTCACHGGSFDLTGRNVGGPPPRPLPAFVVNLRQRAGGGGHDIVVSRA
jgi:Rieske Fe-S protein